MRDFGSIREVTPPELELAVGMGGTSLGTAAELALKLLDERKRKYKALGVDYYQPWLVLMTDGCPTDDTHTAVAKDVRDRIAKKLLTTFPIGIGTGADMAVLGLFTVDRTPLRLKELRFKEFFAWLSRSVAKVSQSTPGEKVDLPPGVEGWAHLST